MSFPGGSGPTPDYCRSFRTSDGVCWAWLNMEMPDCIRIWSVVNVVVSSAKFTSTSPE